MLTLPFVCPVPTTSLKTHIYCIQRNAWGITCSKKERASRWANTVNNFLVSWNILSCPLKSTYWHYKVDWLVCLIVCFSFSLCFVLFFGRGACYIAQTSLSIMIPCLDVHSAGVLGSQGHLHAQLWCCKCKCDASSKFLSSGMLTTRGKSMARPCAVLGFGHYSIQTLPSWQNSDSCLLPGAWRLPEVELISIWNLSHTLHVSDP